MGRTPRDGDVAMRPPVPFGTRYLIHSGPFAGKVVTVADRIGDGNTEFDIWQSNCDTALAYGYQDITIERLP